VVYLGKHPGNCAKAGKNYEFDHETAIQRFAENEIESKLWY
jgi:hypothetical protein